MAVQPPRPCALPESLRHYVLRDNVMVPLVPVDQLPFQLQGVPRRLDHRQLCEEHWKFVEETDEPASPLPILAPTTRFPSQSTPSIKPRFLAPDHHVRTESASMYIDQPRSARASLPPPLPLIEGGSGLPRSVNPISFERPCSPTDSFASIHQKDAQSLGFRTPYPSGIEPDPSKKEYCTHWIKTGECAFISIGCKFKHEMPSAEKLRELGFTQGLPKWWKEKSALGARELTWMQRRLAGTENRELSNEYPVPYAFPDTAAFRTRRDALCPLDGGLDSLRGALKRNCSVSERERITSARGPMREEPASPKQGSLPTTTKPTGQIVNLLIDFDEIPAPPPSPQLSSSSRSDEFSDTQSLSNRASPSTPATEYLPLLLSNEDKSVKRNDEKLRRIDDKLSKANERKSVVTNQERLHKSNLEVVRGTEYTVRPSLRRHSKASLTSSSEEDTKSNRLVAKRKSSPPKPSKRTPSKQLGLANSKHANPSRNVENHRKNPSHKLLQHETRNEVAPGLQAVDMQIRRDGRHNERARRGAISEEGQVPATPAAVTRTK
ncbi:hypothetical protein P153DRAFT_365983 [Dothidotthia symphoricarpi CBS 119687]|uniref:C3H1-type domain-containing protein n=1 Tax=Dothidotthia symphoricarpi CBS 119687 TaxID=1392245 RepID=A0A6A6AFN4_9PLEO|nr:uncharacterized protein P153DRAFT_365983 [Dothidotthia symphoricarpi CBS 119687]KAF2130376.1 hypothetical protein P153DRAFT_365983 [Dothidotthia symphoricarpi CBS 119687]